jgi:hypothetical protein
VTTDNDVTLPAYGGTGGLRYAKAGSDPSPDRD